MVRVVRLERTVSWSQTRRDTNFAIPGYSISAIIPRRAVKIKFFLSVVTYVVKADFIPLSAIVESPANAGVARLCGVSPYPAPDTATALPKQARYQLRYTRLFSFLSGWAYSPKSSAIPTSLHPDIHFPAMIPRRGVKIKFFLSVVIYVVKAAFVPLSAIGENPANAGVARLCGVSQCPVPDTATALPKQARYQLRYCRLERPPP